MEAHFPNTESLSINKEFKKLSENIIIYYRNKPREEIIYTDKTTEYLYKELNRIYYIFKEKKDILDYINIASLIHLLGNISGIYVHYFKIIKIYKI